MKKSTGQNYRKRLSKVVDYIYQHLDEDLGVNTLAEIAMMSPYHFHRIYREMAQETVNATVRRLRLERAASDLIRTNLPLLTIAKSVSYGSLEAFSRAFTNQYGESPSQYRADRNVSTMKQEISMPVMLDPQEEYYDMYDVEMLDFEGVYLAGYEHQGDYMEIGNVFEKIFLYASSHGLMSEKTRSFGIYYDDPKSVDEKDLRSMACISVEQSLESKDEDAPNDITVPASKCASVLFKGSYAELEKPYDWFFGHWLPQSGYEAADFPPFEEYLNDPKTTPPSELLTRIYCLLAE